MNLKAITLARAELAQMIEPGDQTAGILIADLGPQEAHRLVTENRTPSAALLSRIHDIARWHEIDGVDLPASLAKWRENDYRRDGAAALEDIAALAGGVLIPEDPAWPDQLTDLSFAAPIALWYRTNNATHPRAALDGFPWACEALAVLGDTDPTSIARDTCWEVTTALAGYGHTIMTTTDEGIAATALSASLVATRPEGARIPAGTIAVVPGGLSKLTSHDDPTGTLDRVAAEGLLLSAEPPRNRRTEAGTHYSHRIITALAGATAIIEATRDSEAMDAARAARDIDRPVGAFPGAISPATAGCHDLIRIGSAELITDAADALRMLTDPVDLPN